jgi:hypothetical protein
VVLVEGEQGIGKTSVLHAGLAVAQAAGCRMLWGAADELRQRFPLQLMMACLGSAAESGQAGDPLAGSCGVMSGDPVLAEVERLLAVVDVSRGTGAERAWCEVGTPVCGVGCRRAGMTGV